MSDAAITAKQYAWDRRMAGRLDRLDSRALFIAVAAAALLIYAQFQFWKLPVRMDRANWDYFAQVIARGGVPYRDVMNIKSPLSAYIGATAIVITRPLGLRDVYAIRVTYLLLAALTVAFTFLVAHDYFGNRALALLAAIIMLSFNSFGSLNSRGVEPKTPMVLFGLMALWAILSDRPFLAGLLGMLSALCWQPGLMFVGIAALSFSRYLTSWRDLKLLKVVAGAILPLVAMILYFWAAGALKDFYLWCIHYNYTVYAPAGRRSVAKFFERFSEILGGSYKAERFYFYAAAVGWLSVLAVEVRRATRDGAGYVRSSALRHAVLFPLLIYFIFCMINMQGGPDFIPLLPYVAIFAAVALYYAWLQVAELIARFWPRFTASSWRERGLAAICLVIFFANVADAFSYKVKTNTLQQQDQDVAEIKGLLEPGDKIFVHGQTEVLVLSGLTNASKYFFLDRHKDNYLDQVEPGGFEGWFERLKAERPKVVALSRLKPVRRAQQFLDWVESDYELHKGRVMEYYVRRD